MKSKRILLIGITSLLVVIITLGGCDMGAKESTAQEKYPTKPITLIVPFAAGGTTDIIARMLERSAYQYFNQSFVVVNKPGGAATIGLNELASANPDGYTIGVVPMSLILQPLYGPTRYHYPTALEPLARVESSPMIIATLARYPWQNLNELIAYTKSHPNEIKFGHSGLGTASHIIGEMFAREAVINIVQVPFKGGAEALTALLGGHIQLVITGSLSPLKEHIENGTIRLLGISAERRLTLPDFENVPTLKEQGINVSLSSWNGIAAPKGLPAAEKATLAAALKQMINDPTFKADMENVGVTVEYLGSDEFSQEWIEDNAKLTKIVKETGIADLIATQKK